MIYDNVKIGKGSTIEPGVILGPPDYRGKKIEVDNNTIIGKNAYIRARTIIHAGVKIGDNFECGPNVLIRSNNIIGDNVVVWHGSTLNTGNRIGKGSRIHTGCFLEMVTLGKNVFLGPNVTFTNDPHPVMPANFKECWGGAIVEDFAIIGASVTLLPHVRIGKRAVVGAGAVVTKDVPAFMVAVGNPAKVIKRVQKIECKRGSKTHRPYTRTKK